MPENSSRDRLYWSAPAKLNLFLHITGRRADGYHELQTVFQFLDFGDRLYFSLRKDGQVRRKNSLEGVPEEKDLVVRAAKLLQVKSGSRLGVDIEVEKYLPMGGGLGGGSSDAATTLVALNRLWQLEFTEDQLAEMGLALGADVPVFVRGRAAWAEGIGENLQSIDLPEPWYVVLVPDVSVSTSQLFADPQLTRDARPIKIGDYLAQVRSMEKGWPFCNVFEEPVRQKYPEIDAAICWLSQYSPARLTGTGACVFAAFDHEQQAKEVSLKVERIAGRQWQSFVGRGCNRSPLYSKIAPET